MCTNTNCTNKNKELTPIGRTFSSMFLSCLMVVMLSGLLVAAPATAQETFVTVVDDQGPDMLDQGTDPGNSQQDITGARIGDQGSFGWAWDETDLSGNNSIDTCTYFEETDGTVVSVCYSVQFEPDGTVTTGFPEFEVYDCGMTYDGAQQKCTGNNPVSTDYALTCEDPVQVPSYFTPDDQPDLQADCLLTLANGDPADDLLLLNTCTKTSASPSSNSNDCLFSDAVGFLQLEKVVVDGDAVPADFTLTAGTLTGTAPVALSPVTADVPQALSESSPLIDDGTYQLDSIVCTDNNTGTELDTSSGSVTVSIGQRVTCTFTNSIAFVPDPAIELVKDGSLDLGADGVANPGDLINYTFEVTNVGNVDLTDVTVTDLMVSPITCPQTTLATDPDGEEPFNGEMMTCTGSYAITQADIDAGQKINNAEACGTAPDDTEVCDPGDHTEPITQEPELSITKTATEQSYDAVGDIINYTIVATNIGNTTLDNVTVTDPLVSDLTCDPANGSTLAPGDSMTCTATHTVTQADIDAGSFANVACVDDGPNGAPEVCDDEDVPADQNPALSITKTATEQSYDAVGDIINYTIVATNIGNTTLDNVTVTDPLVSDLTCDPANGSTLAPGDSMTCTATHTVTQADIDAGSFANVACVDDGPNGAPEVCDDEDVPADQNPALSITKTATEQSYDAVGDIINYTIVATNIGNTILDNVTVYAIH